MTDRSVLSIAAELVDGPRQGDYGHPLDNFTQIADAFTVLLRRHLRDDAALDPDDVWRLFVAAKLCRDSHLALRDNRIDVAGYAHAGDLAQKEAERRAEPPSARPASPGLTTPGAPRTAPGTPKPTPAGGVAAAAFRALFDPSGG